MARFSWLGEPPIPNLTFTDTTVFRVRTKTGTQVLHPIAPNTKFNIGEDIGYELIDPVTIATLQADPRFSQIS